MADQDQRLALLLQRSDDVLDLRSLLHTQRRRRLVHDGELGVERRGPGDRNALALTAGHVLDGVCRLGIFTPVFSRPCHRGLAHALVVEDREWPEH